MEREDIIRMAREAGLLRTGNGWTMPERWGADELERFAALVAAAERKACARVCEEIEETCWESWDTQADPLDQGSAICAGHCAAAIRARGEK